MAKYLVESYYTCSFKVKHYIDNLSEKELENLDQREDGRFASFRKSDGTVTREEPK